MSTTKSQIKRYLQHDLSVISGQGRSDLHSAIEGENGFVVLPVFAPAKTIDFFRSATTIVVLSQGDWDELCATGIGEFSVVDGLDAPWKNIEDSPGLFLNTLFVEPDESLQNGGVDIDPGAGLPVKPLLPNTKKPIGWSGDGASASNQIPINKPGLPRPRLRS
jgi:hypothetical protein